MISTLLTLVVFLSPAIGGCVVYFVSRFFNERQNMIKILSFLSSLPPLILTFYLIHAKISNLYYGDINGAYMFIDNFSLLFLLMFSVVFVISLLFSFDYMSNRVDQTDFYSSFLFLYSLTLGTVTAGDLFTFFILYEGVAIIVILISLFTRNAPSVMASVRYMRMVSIGSGFYFFAIALIYGSTGTLNLQLLPAQISKIDPKVSLLIQSLLMISFGIEAALFPLHFWLPDLYASALAPVCSSSSGVVVTLGVYAFSRFMPLIFPSNEWWWRETLFLISFFSIIFPNILAFAQDNFKRLLAYSTIFNLGVSTLLVSIGSKLAIEAMILQLLAHAIAKSSLFFVSGFISRSYSTLSLNEIKKRNIPFEIKFTVLLSVLSLMGFPPTLGFFSKVFSLIAIVNLGMSLGTVAILLVVMVSFILSFPYYLKVIRCLVLSHGYEEKIEVPKLMLLSMIAMDALLIILPFFIQDIINLV
ncbi:MAG: proton-conducting transporter membrane subunit [Thermoproteota archaeon]